ncbi:MAG: iron-containing alcohol dehydrogenase [Nanoarchaeota archaeon]
MIYYVPTKIYFGNGSLNKLNEIVSEINPKNIFLMTGKNSLKKTDSYDLLLNSLKDYRLTLYDEVSPNPKLEEITRALNKAEETYPDLIIGIGGGSVLDTSKIISLSFKDKKIKKKIPLIAIPTTAGTGSEVTPFAAYSQNKKKISFGNVGNYLVYPNYAIVDPELTLTMPRDVTASSGLDALSQALESYWSINSTPLSDTHALMAIKLVLENLDYSYERINNINSKFNMSRASLEAGLAFSQTATTAPHSVAYPMTSHFGSSHGNACALTLPEFLLYNYNIKEEDCLDKRGSDFVKRKLDYLCNTFEFRSINHLYEEIRSLIKKIGSPLTLNEAGIDNIEIILENGFSPERMNNNPRRVTRESLQELLEKIK